jgi:hypothetical protein
MPKLHHMLKYLTLYKLSELISHTGLVHACSLYSSAVLIQWVNNEHVNVAIEIYINTLAKTSEHCHKP